MGKKHKNHSQVNGNIDSIIPFDRPALGRDLGALHKRLGCSVKHMIAVMGVSSSNKWQEITVKNADVPLQDAALALVTRFFDRYPELFPLEWDLDIGDVLAMLAEKNMPMSASRLAVLVGRSKTVGPKWVKGTHPDPSANAAIKIIDVLLKIGNFEYWMQIAEEEARARGLRDTDAQPGSNIDDRLGIDSWGGRKNIKEYAYDGTDRRSKVNQIPVVVDRRKKTPDA